MVVVGGEATEKEYFEILKSLSDNAVIKVFTKPVGPNQLAEYARKLLERENKQNDGSDSFKRVFVVTDVDDFTLVKLHEAQKICKGKGMELIISNPCFEVWLIDHLIVSNELTSAEAAHKAAQLGLTGGRGNKHIAREISADDIARAVLNARCHNVESRRIERRNLSSLDFAPWTDMVDVVESFKLT